MFQLFRISAAACGRTKYIKALVSAYFWWENVLGENVMEPAQEILGKLKLTAFAQITANIVKKSAS